LVVEILSPGSVRRDRYEKPGLYAQFGVREYWIIDQANRSVEIRALGEGRYSLHSSAVERGRVASRLLAGFELDLAALWPAGS
jgi:Uma2 family endonuclease